jgi:hypothetical protein
LMQTLPSHYSWLSSSLRILVGMIIREGSSVDSLSGKSQGEVIIKNNESREDLWQTRLFLFYKTREGPHLGWLVLTTRHFTTEKDLRYLKMLPVFTPWSENSWEGNKVYTLLQWSSS